jgi:hypothetical protein
MGLKDPEVEKIIALIRDSFRVRLNDPPIYVDVAGNLGRIASKQHQVIFGRRGSGKSCLLVHFFSDAQEKGDPPIYILADEFKRLSYPDVLIRLLIEILEEIPVRRRSLKKAFRWSVPIWKHSAKLRMLLDLAEESDVTEGQTRKRSKGAGGGLGVGEVKAGASISADDTYGRTSTFRERKLDTLERHLKDYKAAIREALRASGGKHIAVLIDDFYLLPRERHPDVLDYLHRLVRDTNLFMKVATIRHRTSLVRNHPQTVGIELAQDVEELSLDRTLEDLGATQDFLHQMLGSIAQRVGISNVDDLFNPDAFQALTLVSGGVPRDFLTIFVNAIEAARNADQITWLTPTHIYKGAGRLAYNTKLQNLKEDAGFDVEGIERVFVDLLHFCLKESRKTAFLISQEEGQRHPREHDLIQQLMDFKLIHVVEPDTSAASGRPGRYEAYTLDFSLFMEPRRRNIEIVEFWKVDEQRRRKGIREAPVYPLERLRDVFDDVEASADAIEVLEEETAGEN